MIAELGLCIVISISSKFIRTTRCINLRFGLNLDRGSSVFKSLFLPVYETAELDIRIVRGDNEDVEMPLSAPMILNRIGLCVGKFFPCH